MKKISLWAKHNPVKARFLIAIFTVIIFIQAILFGTFLYFEDLKLVNNIIYIPILTLLIGILYYPAKTQCWQMYIRQKSCDFIIVISGFFVLAIAMCNFANNQSSFTIYQHKSGLSFSVFPTLVVNLEKPSTEHPLITYIKKHKKEIRKYLKQIKKEYKEEGNKKGVAATKFFLTLLTLGGAIFLGAIVASASCSLSCNGNTGAAYVVGIGGLVGIIALLVISFRRISKMGTEEAKPISTEGTDEAKPVSTEGTDEGKPDSK